MRTVLKVEEGEVRFLNFFVMKVKCFEVAGEVIDEPKAIP